MLNGEIVKEYLEKFPNTPSLTLARMVYRDNPECFMSVEQARCVVRYYRGAIGDKDRKSLKDKRYVRKSV